MYKKLMIPLVTGIRDRVTIHTISRPMRRRTDDAARSGELNNI